MMYDVPKEIIKFLIVRDVIPPSRAYPTDAGIDFYVPKFTEKFLEDLREKNPSSCFSSYDENDKRFIPLKPQQRILIPSGIHSKMFSPGRALVAANKSGISSKYGLVYGAQVIDYTYKGEIHINVINTSSDDVYIYENIKIIQFIELPIFTSTIEVTSIVDGFYDNMKNDRGEGGFGSTDKK